MPVTPFHIIAGVVVKSAKPKYFSWTVFALANVLIDTEAVYYFFTTGIHVAANYLLAITKLSYFFFLR